MGVRREITINASDVEGPSQWWDNPPDFNLLRQGLDSSGFVDEDLALGSNGLPVVAEFKGNYRQQYRLWLGPEEFVDLSLDYGESLVAGLRKNGLESKIKMNGFDSITCQRVKFPHLIDKGIARIRVQGGNSCWILIGVKKINSADGQ